MVVLPDVLAPGLRVVFCGSAAGAASARAGAYYAGPGNRFWTTLHEIGLTPRRLAPTEFAALANHGIGLTDLAKTAAGSDADLPPGADDPAGLEARIRAAAPRVLAFNGKRPARVFLRHVFAQGAPACGRQNETVGETALFVLPSTSGAARRHWDIGPWRALAQYLETARGPQA